MFFQYTFHKNKFCIKIIKIQITTFIVDFTFRFWSLAHWNLLYQIMLWWWVSIFCRILCIKSGSEMMKNVFYLFLKVHFILKIFKFLSWVFGHFFNFKIYDVTTWLKYNYNIHCPISHKLKATKQWNFVS